ncbi:hypothetical protein FZEAL_9419 [Fusarium zealandicum]|uniref:Heterokaryon incompatibility domain-containing protein n=1 Tax=Fusarium zealandicum TaxID=1053134 RepID=A0A8H4UB19_9HYPO|nr:hypothetical protein FZEAL_9419 [Fusarium zealandicum]
MSDLCLAKGLAVFRQRAQEYGLHTCGYCQTLVTDVTDATDVADILAACSDPPYVSCLRTSHVPRDQVFEAVANGCALFKYCTQPYHHRPYMAGHRSNILLTEDVAHPLELTMALEVFAINSTHDTRLLGFSFRWESDGQVVDEGESWLLRLRKSFLQVPAQMPDSLWAEPAIKPTLDSDEAFSRYRRLLDDCIDSHPECRNVRSMPPPSRLIDVRRFQLVSSASFQAAPTWAALSYCWGGPQTTQTCKQNIADRYKAIQLRSLPRTLQDAILVCQKLDIPYLWIDSICIVQDDEVDKAEEINKMPNIFQGALVTICASRASSCDQGFLGDLSPFEPATALPLKCSQDDYDFMQVADSNRPSFDPLKERAWAFQERLLSSRILDYQERTVTVKCRRFEKSHKDFGPTLEASLSFHPESATEVGMGQLWGQLVHEYSERLLTFPGDRLVAMAAIAERFAEMYGLGPADYVAGFWKPTMAEDLMWRQWPREKSNERESLGVAPSWSWASYPGQVLQPSYLFSVTAQILSTELQPTDNPSPFASAKNGRLVIQGLLCQPKLIVSDSGHVDWYHSEASHRTTLTFDYPEHLTDSITSWFLEIASNPGPTSQPSYGLMLRPTGNTDEYVRIGTYQDYLDPPEHDQGAWSADYEQCTRIRGASRTVVHIV